MSNVLRIACALLASGTLAGPAFADEGAEEHVRRGVELRKVHRDVDALQEFHAAYALSQKPQIRAQLGLAEQALGQWTLAESDLQAALAADDEWIVRNREALEQALSFVRLHLAWLEIDSNVQGAELLVNGVSVGHVPLPSPVRVVVGNAIVRVQADGYQPAESSVRIEASDHAREFIALTPRSTAPSEEIAPRPSAPAGAAAPAKRRTAPVPWGAMGVTGIGVLGVGVGAVFGVITLTDKAARDERCGARFCDAEGLALDRQARRDATISTVAFSVGGVVAAVGGWLLWRALEPHPVRSGLRFAPNVSMRAASLDLEGTF